jgi:hypothetical protein
MGSFLEPFRSSAVVWHAGAENASKVVWRPADSAPTQSIPICCVFSTSSTFGFFPRSLGV